MTDMPLPNLVVLGGFPVHHIKAVLIFILFLGSSLSLYAGWIVRPDVSKIEYSAQQDRGYQSFEEALQRMSDSGRIQKVDVVFTLSDEIFQKELFSELERDAPHELQEALKSSGNMHNPAMHQLWKPFEKALLATPTIRKLNASLAAYGLGISRAGVEKFELRNTLADSRRRFHGSLCLYASRMPDPWQEIGCDCSRQSR